MLWKMFVGLNELSSFYCCASFIVCHVWWPSLLLCWTKRLRSLFCRTQRHSIMFYCRLLNDPCLCFVIPYDLCQCFVEGYLMTSVDVLFFLTISVNVLLYLITSINVLLYLMTSVNVFLYWITSVHVLLYLIYIPLVTLVNAWLY